MFQTAPVLLGQYRPLDSYLHRLDARAKILPVTLVLVLALLTESFVFYIAILTALVAALLFSGVGVRTLVDNFKPILLLVVITSLYHLIFSGHGTHVLLKLGGIQVTQGGVHLAAFYSLRLIIFVSMAFLITLTNSPSELGDAVTKILKPLRRFRVPVYDLSLILFIAMRFIPILYDEFNTIRNAQIVRGVRFSGSILARMRKSTSIIIPVFVAAVQRADELALAIQARGYRSGAERTFYSLSTFGIPEWIFSLGSSAGILAVYFLTK